MKDEKKLRAVAVGRVSRVGDRDTASVEHQHERIRDYASANSWTIVAEFTEENVSGRAPLDRRTGLLPAVEMIERGEADVIAVAYFDRFVRSIARKDEVVTRVENAGGRIVALDVGSVSNESAASWMSGAQNALIAEYFARNVSDRTRDAQRAAIEEGRPIIARVPPGYVRTEIPSQRGGEGTRLGPLAIDQETGPTMTEFFLRRADGATLAELRAFLAENGIERSIRGVHDLLKNRIYLGEISFRDWTNAHAHPALTDVGTFERVQRMSVPKGRYSKSNRLLSRLGLLRCHDCEARMTLQTTRAKMKDGTEKEYAYYFCRNADCLAPAKIHADRAETMIAERAIAEGKASGVKSAHGRASSRLDALKSERENVERDLVAAVEAFSALLDVPAAREKLDALKIERDRLDDEIRDLESVVGSAKRIATPRAWDLATVPERRSVLLATFARIVCLPDSDLEFVV